MDKGPAPNALTKFIHFNTFPTSSENPNSIGLKKPDQTTNIPLKKPTHYLTKSVALAALATGLSLVPFEAMAIEKFEYANLPTTEIKFTGLGGSADISFNTSVIAGPTLGGNIEITGSEPAGSGAIGFIGKIEGTFTMGAGATVAPITSVGGKLTIWDGPLGTASPNYFTADLEWGQIENFTAGPVSIGALGLSGNLSNFVVTGTLTDPDLLAFAGGDAERSAFLTFLLVPGKTLDQLRTLGADNHTSYAGVLTNVVPEASNAGSLAGAAVAGLGIFAQIRRRRSVA